MPISEFDESSYLYEGIESGMIPKELSGSYQELLDLENMHLSATREISTKLENLNSEFNTGSQRNPIHSLTSRVKTPTSIVKKLQQKGHELTVESARKNLDDIAGIRVVCPYIEDVYLISELLLKQDDIGLIRTSDYIKNPKQNGYRSLHHVITVPVFTVAGKEIVNVEIQLRTIAMDWWASLEHELYYKIKEKAEFPVFEELKACASEIAEIDKRMQKLYNISLNSAAENLNSNINKNKTDTNV